MGMSGHLENFIVDLAYWSDETRHQGTLWREIQRDGVSLMPETVS